MTVNHRRRKGSAPELPPGEDSPDLPLRWGVILPWSIVSGLATGSTFGPGAGIFAGVSTAVGLHQLLK
jgi:hypothetical protein